MQIPYSVITFSIINHTMVCSKFKFFYFNMMIKRFKSHGFLLLELVVILISIIGMFCIIMQWYVVIANCQTKALQKMHAISQLARACEYRSAGEKEEKHDDATTISYEQYPVAIDNNELHHDQELNMPPYKLISVTVRWHALHGAEQTISGVVGIIDE